MLFFSIQKRQLLNQRAAAAASAKSVSNAEGMSGGLFFLTLMI